eukprot:13554749-Alexandrium_andersonii.AAC.1
MHSDVEEHGLNKGAGAQEPNPRSTGRSISSMNSRATLRFDPAPRAMCGRAAEVAPVLGVA